MRSGRGVKAIVKGHKELLGDLKRLGKEAKKINRKAVRKATAVIKRKAKSEVPVDEGVLRKAITDKIISRGTGANGIVGADASVIGEDGSKPAHYDHLVHYGYQHADGTTVPGDPYLERAWEMSIAEARRVYAQQLKAGIEAVKTGGKK